MNIVFSFEEASHCPKKQNKTALHSVFSTHISYCVISEGPILSWFSHLYFYILNSSGVEQQNHSPRKTLISPLFAATGDITQFYLPTKTDALLDLQRVLEGGQKQGGTTPEVQQPLWHHKGSFSRTVEFKHTFSELYSKWQQKICPFPPFATSLSYSVGKLRWGDLWIMWDFKHCAPPICCVSVSYCCVNAVTRSSIEHDSFIFR